MLRDFCPVLLRRGEVECRPLKLEGEMFCLESFSFSRELGAQEDLKVSDDSELVRRHLQEDRCTGRAVCGC